MRLHGEATDALGLRAMVPVSVRADIERGALGNRVAAMWATLPVGVTDPVQRLHDGQRRDEGRQAVRSGGRRRDPHPPFRIRPADDHGAGGSAPGAPAPVQPRGDQHPRAPVPALPAGARAGGDLPDGAAGREHRSGDRDPQLQRTAQLRPGGRLRRAGRRRGPGRRAARLDRRAGGGGRGACAVRATERQPGSTRKGCRPPRAGAAR